MAPSKSLPAAKLALCLTFLRTSATAYTLKDLEKLLPPAAGISSMAVKDYVTALVNESQLNQEKIGSGNWYWVFPADVRLAKERQAEGVRAELEKARKAVESMEEAVEEERARLNERENEGNGGAETDSDDEGEGREGGRVGLVERLKFEEERRETLKRELEEYSAARVDAGQTEALKMKANMLVDNIYTLEAWVKNLTGGDPETMAGLRAQVGYEDGMDYIE